MTYVNSKMLKNKANRCSRRELIQQLLKFEAQKNEQIRFFPKRGFPQNREQLSADRFSSQVGVFSLIETSVVIEVELREAADRKVRNRTFRNFFGFQSTFRFLFCFFQDFFRLSILRS